ncbi:sensor histidine kinase [Nocardia callitridis]|uniref:histidine kinase n=1 Tax=Nocardia callitridis TaxID=648753 RepID=A0ABP9K3C5_9NOCA
MSSVASEPPTPPTEADDEASEADIKVRRAPYAILMSFIVITAAVLALAVLSAPEDFRVRLATGSIIAAVMLCIVATLAVHYREETQRYRDEAHRLREVTHRAKVDAAAALEQADGHERESRTSENRRAAAMAAFAGAAGRMQAMTTSMLAELRDMEHRHADPSVLADLLHLDHRSAQAGRLADSIAVLSGARSGRRWAKPIGMESILRGAMGRVSGYQRVRLRAVADIAIAGHAAEGVMHTLAELLDNACNFSPPTTEVHVYATEAPAGVVLTIEDSGLVMSESALRRAEQTVSGAATNTRADLSSLTGTRLGLAVVGHLARKHGLTVNYRPSAIGGTAVVVVVPRDLTVRTDPTPMPALTAPPASGERAPTPPAVEDVAPRRGLPKRRRGSTLAAVHPEGLFGPKIQSEPPAVRPTSPSSLGAFQRAVSAQREDSTHPTDGSADAAPAPSDVEENDR